MSEDIFYQKSLQTGGCIVVQGYLFNVKVKSLSVTGLLAELDADDSIKNIYNLLQNIASSSSVDVHLPELQLGGTAKITWSNQVDDCIHVAIEFCTMMRITNPLHSRRIPRKNITIPGQLVVNGESYSFSTENISITGLMVRIEQNFDVSPGMVMAYSFWWLDLSGEAQVVWGIHNDESTLMGLKCLNDNLGMGLDNSASSIPLIDQDTLLF